MADGLVVIIMGSDSDYEEHGSKIEKECKGLGLETEVRVLSAHRTPEHVLAAIKTYDKEDIKVVYITVAGMSDGLSGMVAGATSCPTIACPPPSKTGDSHADYRSSYNMPPGIAHAFIPNPKNAAIYAAKIMGVTYERFETEVHKVLEQGATKVDQADLKYKERLL